MSKPRTHYEPPHSTSNSACGWFAEAAESSANISEVTCKRCIRIYWGGPIKRRMVAK